MAVETSSGVPVRIIAGDTSRFSLSYGAYPAESWSLAFILQRPDGQPSVAKIAVDGVVELSSTVTDSLAHGVYSYAVRAATLTGDVEVATVDFGQLIVTQNPAKPVQKSWAREALDKAEAGLVKLAGGSNATVSINGQSFTKRSLKELMDFRDRLKTIVMAEERTTNSRPQNIGIRFK